VEYNSAANPCDLNGLQWLLLAEAVQEKALHRFRWVIAASALPRRRRTNQVEPLPLSRSQAISLCATQPYLERPVSEYNPLDPDTDPFRPPAISTIVHCIHCNQEYDSYRIEWRVSTDHEGQPAGFWCCPIEGCDGKGFGFDIFPIDPNYQSEDGNMMWFDDSDGEEDEFEDGDGEEDGFDEEE
jgi:hypothetical protein